jgi:outer membrane protein TolC
MYMLLRKFIFSFLLLLITGCIFSQERNLEYYINAGLQNSPLLKDYTNQKAANLIDSMRILAGYKPQVSGLSVNNYAPTYKGWGYDGAVTNGANFSQQVVATKRLVSKENLQNQNEAIRLLNESLDITGRVTEQDLKKSIIAQYITAYGVWQQYSFNNELLLLIKKQETVLKKLTEKGVYRQTDYLSFLVTLQQQEILISQVKIQFQNEFSSLNYLSGIQDTVAMPLTKPEVELAVLPDAESSVFYQQFRIDSMRLKNNDALIEFNYKPKVNLYADGGYLTSFAEQAYKNFGTSFGVNITVPIYDGKQKKMQHDKISIAEQTRQNYRDYFKKQFGQEIAQLSQQLTATQQLINQTAPQIRYTETLIEANRKLMETGDARMADYIIAIGNYISAKNIVTQSSINKLQLINQINYWNRK